MQLYQLWRVEDRSCPSSDLTGFEGVVCGGDEPFEEVLVSVVLLTLDLIRAMDGRIRTWLFSGVVVALWVRRTRLLLRLRWRRGGLCPCRGLCCGLGGLAFRG
jgi:hypothetical protein